MEVVGCAVFPAREKARGSVVCCRHNAPAARQAKSFVQEMPNGPRPLSSTDSPRAPGLVVGLLHQVLPAPAEAESAGTSKAPA